MNPVRGRSPQGDRSRAIGGAASIGVNIPEGLPPHAQNVFRGHIWDIWQWEQVMYDGSTAIYESAKRAHSATVIPVVDTRILIERQEQPFRGKFISFPGGFCEEGEPQKDAQRELLEETGYTSDDWHQYMVFSPGGSRMDWKNYFYIARNCKKIKEMAPDPGEKITLELVSLDDFLAFADDSSWRHSDFIPTMLRARYIHEKRREFEKLLFG